MNYIEKKYNEAAIFKYHIIAILPLIVYGIYKNGISLYLIGEVNFLESLMPITYLIGFILIMYFIKKKLKRNFNINDFYYLATVLFLPITYNYLLVFILFSFCYFLSITKIKIPFNILFIILLYTILGDNLTFLNPLEETRNFNYSFLDLLIGKGESHLMTSSILFIIMSFVFLSLMPYYKSIISISFGVFYILLTVTVGRFLNYDFTNIFPILATMILLGSSFSYTPITKVRMILYSLVVALLSIIFNYNLDYYIGIFIAIFIVQIITFYKKN